jgi:hypothetical protein
MKIQETGSLQIFSIVMLLTIGMKLKYGFLLFSLNSINKQNLKNKMK